MHNIIRKRLNIKLYNKALLYSEKKQLIFRKIYIYYCIPCIYFFWSTGGPLRREARRPGKFIAK